MITIIGEHEQKETNMLYLRNLSMKIDELLGEYNDSDFVTVASLPLLLDLATKAMSVMSAYDALDAVQRVMAFNIEEYDLGTAYRSEYKDVLALIDSIEEEGLRRTSNFRGLLAEQLRS